MHDIKKNILDLRQKKPLVLNLTNLVTMDFIANCLLALGAAPIMSICEDELEELVKISSVIYINIGTLDNSFIRLAKKAVDLAKKHKKSVILDPVGAGATAIRTSTAKYILPHAAIVRGNASEIMALSEHHCTTKGVESVHTLNDAREVAIELALNNKITVVVSGPIDFITDGTNSAEVIHGSPLMQLVTGMGCALTAVIATFEGIMNNPFEASIIGARYFALCGEIVAFNSKNPGIFRSKFIDQLYEADFEKIEKLYDK